MSRRAGLALVLAFAAACAPGGTLERRRDPRSGPVVVSDGRYVMGTIFEITLVARDPAQGKELAEALFAVAGRLDALFTSWDPESALMRWNRTAGQGPQAVEPELARVLALSVALSAQTRGAFDVTVGPLAALWRSAGERGALPAPAEIARARACVGPQVVRADAQAARAELRCAGAAVDLGGVAKGYALDRMRELLSEAGVANALLSFGQSSLLALGAPPDGSGWRLLVRAPEGGFAGLATLRDRAASVSGSLGQWTEIEGRRYGHVIDPRSGEPLVRDAQAMVLAPSAAAAEAWSKALLVLAPEPAIALLAAEGGEGLLLEGDGRRFETPGWLAATDFEPAVP